MTLEDTLLHLWLHLGWPLVRLLLYLSLGLMVALFIESFNWTRKLAFIARPLTLYGHLSPLTGASFSMGFFSSMTANTMLAEGFDRQQISRKELVLANLFNSLPNYFVHLPTTFFITAPLIKGAAFVYVGLTLGAAIIRTLVITLLSRQLLPAQTEGQAAIPAPGSQDSSFRTALEHTIKRFKRRIRKIIRFTVPIYILFYFLTQAGVFAGMESFISRHLSWLAWLSPQAVSIIMLHVVAEFSAGLAAAGSLLADGSMTSREIVLALLVGNILSSPVRAVRHQFPYYAGIFKPALAAELICFSQAFRAASIALMTAVYYFATL